MSIERKLDELPDVVKDMIQENRVEVFDMNLLKLTRNIFLAGAVISVIFSALNLL